MKKPNNSLPDLFLGGFIDNLPQLRRSAARIHAFYLPQFHAIPENDLWWGPGFTEWTNVSQGRPNFEGHMQPKIPRDLGFYDLSNVNKMREQVNLAKGYGIEGFVFYYYWFDGRRVLEKPVENFIASDIDFNFSYAWANENWTRTWDGLDNEVLLAQNYTPNFEYQFIQDIHKALLDNRYTRVDGRPLLTIYRAMSLPNPKESILNLRQAARDVGIGELHIAAVDFYDIQSPDEIGADSLVEFPPHKFNYPENVFSGKINLTNPEFTGGLVDYDKVVHQSLSRKIPEFRLHRGVAPSWDNTARRQNTSTIFVGANPKKFEIWLRYLRGILSITPKDGEILIFVNAWNEWAEGACLEPDLQFGRQYLDAVRKSEYSDVDFVSLTQSDLVKQADLEIKKVNQIEPTKYAITAVSQKSKFVFRLARFLVRWPTIYSLAHQIYLRYISRMLVK